MQHYPGDWHDKFGKMTQDSAEIILGRLQKIRKIESVVEVGCGQAHWSKVAIDLGATQVRAIDGPWNDPSMLVIDPSLYKSSRIDRDFKIEGSFNLAICLEVAEHVESKFCNDLIQQLTTASDMVLFGAAIPYQGGFGHIHEQWQSWWAEKFLMRSFVPYDIVRPMIWGDPRVHYWYKQNTVLYVRKSLADTLKPQLDSFVNWSADEIVRDIVHPEKFLSFAQHDEISFGKLLRKLPRHAWGRVRSKLRLG